MNHPVPQWVYISAVTIAMALAATSVDIYSRQQLHDNRIAKLEDRVSNIDRDGSRQVVALSAKLETIQADLVSLRAEISKFYEKVNEHNENMMNLFSPRPVRDRRTLYR